LKFLLIILFLLVNTVIASTPHAQKENKELVVKRLEIAVDKIEKLGQSEQYAEALSLCNQLLDEYQNNNEPVIEEWIAKVSFYRAVAFGKLGKKEKEIEGYTLIVEKYKQSKSDQVQKVIAKALLFNGIAFHVENKLAESIIFFDQVIQKFEYSNINNVDEYVLKAIVNKAVALLKLGLVDEESALLEYTIKKYQNNNNDSVIYYMPLVINLRAESMIMKNEVINEEISKLMYKYIDFQNDIGVFEMLLILQNAKIASQDEKIEEWIKKFGKINNIYWNFDIFEDRLDTIELDSNANQRIKKYIGVFKLYVK
jgi:tetratricopeptide (TPR) repeat protein